MPDTEPFDGQTLAFYAQEAPVYAASGKGGTSRFLDDFLDRLAAGARILELGCGGGRDAGRMLARGFDVDPTDGVAEIAAKAAANLGRPVRVMRFDALDAVAEYDAVWASASLLHMPLPALPAILAAVHRALRPTGWHFASFKSGGTEGRDRFGRYFNYPAEQALAAAYRAAAPWQSIVTEAYTGGGYEGGQGPWVAVTARA